MLFQGISIQSILILFFSIKTVFIVKKVSFNVKSVDFIILDKNTINLCGRFQEGMINSDGTPRNAKVNLPYYKIMNDIIPEIEKYSYEVTN